MVAALAALVVGTKTLGSILDHAKAVFRGDGVYFVHVRWLAVERHSHDGPGSRCDCCLDLVAIDIAGIRLDIDKHWRRANQSDDFGRSDKGEGRGNNLIPLPDTQSHQSDQQCLGA